MKYFRIQREGIIDAKWLNPPLEEKFEGDMIYVHPDHFKMIYKEFKMFQKLKRKKND